MSNFIERIKDGKVASPTSARFDRELWEKTVASAGSREDSVVASLGLLINDALGALRDVLEFVNNEDFDAFGKRQALLAAANHQGIVATTRGKELADLVFPPSDGAPIERFADIKLPLSLGDFDPDSVIESIVESAGRLIEMLARAASISPSEISTDSFPGLSHDLNIGISYLTLESIWLDVLWNGYRFGTESRFFAVDTEQVVIEAVSNFRHTMNIIHQDVFTYLRKKNAPDLTRGERVRGVNAVYDSTGLVLRAGPITDEERAKDEVVRSATLAPQYLAVAKSRGPAFRKLNLQLVSRAYGVLKGVADAIFEHGSVLLARARSDLTCKVGIGDFGPAISRSNLAEIFSETLGVPLADGEELVHFFVGAGFRVLKNFDHWAAPLVALDEDRVGVFCVAMRHASLPRLTDLWLRRLGFDLQLRGEPFEAEAREALRTTVSASALSQMTQVLKSDFRLIPKADRREQIDLVVILGDRVLIGEVKCFLQPSNKLDRYYHRKKLEEAAVQIKR